MRQEPIVVGLSGGVDSAVSAYLLKEQGYAVTGLFMKNWEDDDREEDGSGSIDGSAEGSAEGSINTGSGKYCSSRQDWIDAASVADVLGIELEAVNFAAEYKDRVFAEFLREYAAGRTPNPDVLCNSEIKFKAFLDHARRLGARRIATGHYARVQEHDGRVALLRGIDPGKDQSYFLHRLTQEQLASAVFPVGGLHKSEVRAIARRIGLPNAAKRDSTGICFIGERPFREFLNRYLPTKPGPIRTPDGQTVGEHMGLSFYTLGQRKGLGIGGRRDGSGDAWFVARKDLATNTLYVVQGHDHPWLLADTLAATDASWIAGEPPHPLADGKGWQGTAKTRYRQTDAACTLRPIGEGSFHLTFDTPQWAATPGQSAVLYDGEVCLGGGIITATEPANTA